MTLDPHHRQYHSAPPRRAGDDDCDWYIRSSHRRTLDGITNVYVEHMPSGQSTHVSIHDAELLLCSGGDVAQRMRELVYEAQDQIWARWMAY